MLDMLAVASDGVIRWDQLGLSSTVFSIGWFELRWYSLAYLAGIIVAYVHLLKMIKAPGAPLAQRHADDLFFYCTLGIILGGRIGYLCFYEPGLWTEFSDDGWITWKALRLWDGGMSFHGGLMGVVAAIGWVAWRGGLSFIRVCDYLAVNVGFGMLFGRLANFVNGELWGRAADPELPWAMVFCDQGLTAEGVCNSSYIPRHPSQLYEAGLEGLLVIIVMLSLFWLTRARYRPGLLVGVFTVLIASGRFIVEFFRMPDAQLAWVLDDTGLSMGQWLTIPLVLAGIGLVAWALAKPPLASGAKARKPAAAEPDTAAEAGSGAA